VLADDPMPARPIVSVLLDGRATFEPMTDRTRWKMHERATRRVSVFSALTAQFQIGAKVGWQVLNKARLAQRINLHAVANNIERVGIGELNPQFDRFRFIERKRGEVQVSDSPHL